MNDKDLMDDLLRTSMAAPAPQLSRSFDAKVMAAVRPRGLTAAGRIAIGVYAVAALIASIWAMKDAGVVLIAASTLVTAAVSLGLSRYARALTRVSGTVAP